MAYEFDIFISYRRTGTAGRWVENHLLKRLEERINEISHENVRISFDKDMETGVRWPDELKRRLVHSRLLLMICSSDYFRSPWCMAEWNSFRMREQRLGLFDSANPRGLTYPVRYADGNHFHPDLLAAQCRIDFTDLNYPDLVFSESTKYLEFDDLVRRMSRELVDRLETVPPWQADFPTDDNPLPLSPPTSKRPKL